MAVRTGSTRIKPLEVELRKTIVTIAIFTLFTLLCTTAWAHAPPRGPGSQQGLYFPDDRVILLNSSNVKETVFGSEHAWFVEFYAHWCGHCIRFAPIYKRFAEEVYDWRNIVTIAALNCAEEMNAEVCSDFDIQGYPTLRFFPPNYRMFNSSGALNKGDEVLHRGGSSSNIIATLKKQLIDRLEPHYPLLLSYTSYSGNGLSGLAELWSGISHFRVRQPDALVLVFENSTSYLGKEVALRLSLYNNLKVYRFPKPNGIYQMNTAMSNKTTWPAVLYLGRDRIPRPVAIEKERAVVSVVQKVLEIAGIDTWTPATTTSEPVEVVSGGSGWDNTAIANNQTDSVSRKDLLHTLHDSLHTEVSIPKVIDGERLRSLQKYLEALVKFFPADRSTVKQFLEELYGWTKGKRSIQASEYRQKLGELEQTHGPWDGVDLSSWQDCKATIPGRRGYPCGLWRLFHTLTVMAIDRNSTEGPMFAIHGYVRDFFGCTECREHFSKMVARDNVLAENNSAPAVQALWLWRAHNEVNLRTKGTPSEDPGYPKQMYPSKQLCPECFDSNGNYDDDQVLGYLKKIYTQQSQSAINKLNEKGQMEEARSRGSRITDFTPFILSFFFLFSYCIAYE